MEINRNFDLKYIFNDNIERVWSFLREPEFLFKANRNVFLDLVPIEGVNLWTVNSSFKLFGASGNVLNFTCIESNCQSHNKKLAYNCRISGQTEFTVSYTLYQISISNTTVVVIEFYDIKTLMSEHKKILLELSSNTYEKLNDYMKRSVLALFQNEGTIIHLNMDKLWNMLIDWNYMKHLTAVHVDAIIFINQDNDTFRPGTEFKLIYCKENPTSFRIKSIDKNEANNKIEFVIQYLSPSLFYFKELRIYLIAISDNSTQISVCHRLSLPETPERIEMMSVIKRRVLTKLKKMAEELDNNSATRAMDK